MYNGKQHEGIYDGQNAPKQEAKRKRHNVQSPLATCDVNVLAPVLAADGRVIGFCRTAGEGEAVGAAVCSVRRRGDRVLLQVQPEAADVGGALKEKLAKIVVRSVRWQSELHVCSYGTCVWIRQRSV